MQDNKVLGGSFAGQVWMILVGNILILKKKGEGLPPHLRVPLTV